MSGIICKRAEVVGMEGFARLIHQKPINSVQLHVGSKRVVIAYNNNGKEKRRKVENNDKGKIGKWVYLGFNNIFTTP